MIQTMAWLCVASAAWLGCAGDPDKNVDTPAHVPLPTNVSGEPQRDPVGPDELANELMDVQVARWAGFQRLAVGRADHDVLGAELFRTMRGSTIAVLTIAVDGTAVRYIVSGDRSGNPRSLDSPIVAALDDISFADSSVLDPSSISQGRPPPQYPVPPGISSAGQTLLKSAFGGGDVVGEPPQVLFDDAQGWLSNGLVDPSLGKERNDVLSARWKGVERLSRKYPNQAILAAEMFRTIDDGTVAVFTVVQGGAPVRFALGGDSQGQVDQSGPPCRSRWTMATDAPAGTDDEDDSAADPATVAMGSPPIKQPGTPGVTATGQSLMSVAFGNGM